MAKPLRRRAFLQRVSCRAPGAANYLPGLQVDSEFARDHVEAACQALSLRLVCVDADDDGFAFRITRAGLYLLDGHVEAAAAVLDSGFLVRRVRAPPPWGALGSRLRPGGQGVSLQGSGARAYAPQLILAVASGHAIVVGDRVLGNANPMRPGSGPPMAVAPAALPGRRRGTALVLRGGS